MHNQAIETCNNMSFLYTPQSEHISLDITIFIHWWV